MHKFTRLVAISFFLFILWIIYLANTNSNSVFFDLVKSIPLGDKIGHFVLFGLLTLVFNTAFKFRKIHFGKIHIYSGTILVTLFVILEELSQIFLSSRTFDYIDLIADGAGIIAFTLLSRLVYKLSN